MMLQTPDPSYMIAVVILEDLDLIMMRVEKIPMKVLRDNIEMPGDFLPVGNHFGPHFVLGRGDCERKLILGCSDLSTQIGLECVQISFRHRRIVVCHSEQRVKVSTALLNEPTLALLC